MTDTERLNIWVERVMQLDELTRNLSDELNALAAVPQGASPDETAATLTTLWRVLGFGDPGRSPAHHDAGQAMAVRLENALGSGPAAFQKLAVNMDAAVTGALGRGAEHADVIRVADFGSSLIRHEVDDSRGGVRIIFLAPLSALPTGHRLRALLPADEFYKAAGDSVLVLGAAISGGGHQTARVRPWYWTESVLGLTRGWRIEQKKKEREVIDREALEKADRVRAWQESPSGREAQLKARVLELEARIAASSTGGY
jgi:hypothetical protein